MAGDAARFTRAAPEEVKLRAIALAQIHGPGYAGRQVGYDRTTVSKWMQERGIPRVGRNSLVAQERQARKRLKLGQDLLHLASDLQRCIRQSISDNDPKAAKDWAVTFAVLYDKYRLEQGQSAKGPGMQMVPPPSLDTQRDRHVNQGLRRVGGLTPAQ